MGLFVEKLRKACLRSPNLTPNTLYVSKERVVVVVTGPLLIIFGFPIGFLKVISEKDAISTDQTDSTSCNVKQ